MTTNWRSYKQNTQVIWSSSSSSLFSSFSFAEMPQLVEGWFAAVNSSCFPPLWEIHWTMLNSKTSQQSDEMANSEQFFPWVAAQLAQAVFRFYFWCWEMLRPRQGLVGRSCEFLWDFSPEQVPTIPRKSKKSVQVTPLPQLARRKLTKSKRRALSCCPLQTMQSVCRMRGSKCSLW